MRQASAFPSLSIGAEALTPQGTFAEAQAEFLRPDPASVARLRQLLASQEAGVVAHYYMDPELQGVLSRVDWPHIRISDSLLMADAGIVMAEQGVKKVVVLGVDFMSENVRAMLDAAGHRDVEVLRVAAEPIGCSLAESAEARAYGAYLTRAAASGPALHVVYINTSLEVKARAQHLVPTITCTSSNVVRTVLQAFAQIPDLRVYFGPDTYMGRNLVRLFEGLAEMDEAAVKRIHPAHGPSTIRALLPRFHHFQQGTCIVHHMFGAEVARTVREAYADCFITAHLEVPGEMFELALEAQREDRGVVGSTSNILHFIGRKVEEASPTSGKLRFILGTEAGMITSIVRDVQRLLRQRAPGLDVEIVFPVAAEAVAATDDAELGIVPGVMGGEGCTTAGGCATCPYMKMNSLDALFDVLTPTPERSNLLPFYPRIYDATLDGRTMADLGGEPILHMRAFQQTGVLPDSLVDDILMRGAKSA